MVEHTMNNSTALIRVVKDGQLALKGWGGPKELPLFQKGEAIPNCTLGTCNSAHFTIFNLNETG
jgi:hypothetical protein